MLGLSRNDEDVLAHFESQATLKMICNTLIYKLILKELKNTMLESVIERSVYNRRKRKLLLFLERVRLKMTEKFNQFESYFFVYSMPFEVCKLSRSLQSKTGKEEKNT